MTPLCPLVAPALHGWVWGGAGGLRVRAVPEYGILLSSRVGIRERTQTGDEGEDETIPGGGGQAGARVLGEGKHSGTPQCSPVPHTREGPGAEPQSAGTVSDGKTEGRATGWEKARGEAKPLSPPTPFPPAKVGGLAGKQAWESLLEAKQAHVSSLAADPERNLLIPPCKQAASSGHTCRSRWEAGAPKAGPWLGWRGEPRLQGFNFPTNIFRRRRRRREGDQKGKKKCV